MLYFWSQKSWLWLLFLNPLVPVEAASFFQILLVWLKTSEAMLVEKSLQTDDKVLFEGDTFQISAWLYLSLDWFASKMRYKIIHLNCKFYLSHCI